MLQHVVVCLSRFYIFCSRHLEIGAPGSDRSTVIQSSHNKLYVSPTTICRWWPYSNCMMPFLRLYVEMSSKLSFNSSYIIRCLSSPSRIINHAGYIHHLSKIIDAIIIRIHSPAWFQLTRTLSIRRIMLLLCRPSTRQIFSYRSSMAHSLLRDPPLLWTDRQWTGRVWCVAFVQHMFILMFSRMSFWRSRILSKALTLFSPPKQMSPTLSDNCSPPLVPSRSTKRLAIIRPWMRLFQEH